MYLQRVLPVEEVTSFPRFGQGILNSGDFESPPMVILIGPYSAGKVRLLQHSILLA